MIATNMEQLKRMIMSEVKAAMQDSSAEILKDMKKEVGEFYSGGTPSVYKRTGQLGRTPKVSDISTGDLSATFDAYLDSAGSYTTGDNPSMMQVLNLANYGSPWTTASGATARPTKGKGGFWERSEAHIETILNNAFAKRFN